MLASAFPSIDEDMSITDHGEMLPDLSPTEGSSSPSDHAPPIAAIGGRLSASLSGQSQVNSSSVVDGSTSNRAAKKGTSARRKSQSTSSAGDSDNHKRSHRSKQPPTSGSSSTASKPERAGLTRSSSDRELLELTASNHDANNHHNYNHELIHHDHTSSGRPAMERSGSGTSERKVTGKEKRERDLAAIMATPRRPGAKQKLSLGKMTGGAGLDLTFGTTVQSSSGKKKSKAALESGGSNSSSKVRKEKLKEKAAAATGNGSVGKFPSHHNHGSKSSGHTTSNRARADSADSQGDKSSTSQKSGSALAKNHPHKTSPASSPSKSSPRRKAPSSSKASKEQQQHASSSNHQNEALQEQEPHAQDPQVQDPQAAAEPSEPVHPVSDNNSPQNGPRAAPPELPFDMSGFSLDTQELWNALDPALQDERVLHGKAVPIIAACDAKEASPAGDDESNNDEASELSKPHDTSIRISPQSPPQRQPARATPKSLSGKQMQPSFLAKLEDKAQKRETVQNSCGVGVEDDTAGGVSSVEFPSARVYAAAAAKIDVGNPDKPNDADEPSDGDADFMIGASAEPFVPTLANVPEGNEETEEAEEDDEIFDDSAENFDASFLCEEYQAILSADVFAPAHKTANKKLEHEEGKEGEHQQEEGQQKEEEKEEEIPEKLEARSDSPLKTLDLDIDLDDDLDIADADEHPKRAAFSTILPSPESLGHGLENKQSALSPSPPIPAGVPAPRPWECTACRYENKEGAHRFCGMCGTGRDWFCPSCSHRNKPTFNFCGMCGCQKVFAFAPASTTTGTETTAAAPQTAAVDAKPPAASSKDSVDPVTEFANQVKMARRMSGGDNLRMKKRSESPRGNFRIASMGESSPSNSIRSGSGSKGQRGSSNSDSDAQSNDLRPVPLNSDNATVVDNEGCIDVEHSKAKTVDPTNESERKPPPNASGGASIASKTQRVKSSKARAKAARPKTGTRSTKKSDNDDGNQGQMMTSAKHENEPHEMHASALALNKPQDSDDGNAPAENVKPSVGKRDGKEKEKRPRKKADDPRDKNDERSRKSRSTRRNMESGSKAEKVRKRNTSSLPPDERKLGNLHRTLSKTFENIEGEESKVQDEKPHTKAARPTFRRASSVPSLKGIRGDGHGEGALMPSDDMDVSSKQWLPRKLGIKMPWKKSEGREGSHDTPVHELDTDSSQRNHHKPESSHKMVDILATPSLKKRMLKMQWGKWTKANLTPDFS